MKMMIPPLTDPSMARSASLVRQLTDLPARSSHGETAALTDSSASAGSGSVEDPERGEDQALMDACAGFEAIFINTLFKSMRQTLPGNGLFPESNEMSIYQSMYDQYLSEDLSQSRVSGLGLKELLYKQLRDDG